MIRILFILCAFFVAALPVTAQQVLDFESSLKTVSGEGDSGEDATVTLDWKAQVKIGLLLGEPLVSTRFQFNLMGGRVTLPTSTARGGSQYETHSLKGVPQDAWSKIALYDVKLRLDFRSNDGSFYLITDVGLPGTSGEWSFNVPGSPDWDKLFIRGSTQADNPVYLDAERAKREVAKGLSFVSGDVVEAHLSLFDLHNWYNALNPDYYIEAYGTAIRQLEDGLRISYGINHQTPKEAETVFQKTVKDRIETADFYKRRLEKLRNIPDCFHIGSNHEPYRQARRQAGAIIYGAQSRQPALTSDQTRLPGGRKAGSPGQFQDRAPQTARNETSNSGGAKTYQIKGIRDGCYLYLEYECQAPYSSKIKNVKYIGFAEQNVPAGACGTNSLGASVRYVPWESSPYKHLTDPRYAGKVQPTIKSFYDHVRRKDSVCKIIKYGAKGTLVLRTSGRGFTNYCNGRPDPDEKGNQKVCSEFGLPAELWK